MAVIRVLIIPADPDLNMRVSDEHTNLKSLQSLVGGNIESVGNIDGAVAYVNEEGKLDGLPFNRRAHTLLVAIAGHNSRDPIVGTAIIAGLSDAGTELNVPDWIVTLAGELRGSFGMPPTGDKS